MTKSSAKSSIAGKRNQNQSWPRKRHKFQRFDERLEEVDIDVFRSLNPIKFEPSGGSSFFHENLVRWRELNAAADFIAIYEELMPLVQTPPQLLLHKNVIVDRLLSCFRLNAMLSLEPILSLIAILSRDLREEFLPCFPKFLNACFELLQSGGDREPDVLEQVITSVSYVIKYMLKFLRKDIKFVLRVTRCLRHYHKSYIQEFVAGAVSYLLRKAPLKELVKGVRKLITEVEVSPSSVKVSGCSALLFHTLKSSSELHSRAQLLLPLLLDETILNGVRCQGGKVVLDVLSGTFHRLCQDLDRDKLELVWSFLTEEMSCQLLQDKESDSRKMESNVSELKLTERIDRMEMEATLQVNDGNVPRLVRLLSLLNGMLEYRKGIRVKDFKPLFMLAQNILNNSFSSSHYDGSQRMPEPVFLNRVINHSRGMLLSETHRFLIGLIKSHSLVTGASTGPAAISIVASSWGAAFDCSDPTCMLSFIGGVLEMESHLVQPFSSHIVRALSRLLESHSTEVLSLFVIFFEKLNVTPHQLRHLLNKAEGTDKLVAFVFHFLQFSINKLELKCEMVVEDMHVIEKLALEPTITWMALQCLPYILVPEENDHTLAWEFAKSIEKFLICDFKGLENLDEDRIGKKKIWESLLGLALKSHTQILLNTSNLCLEKEIPTLLGMATSHTTSVHVLTAVADFLDACVERTMSKISLCELRSKATISMLQVFGKNLSESSKALRLASLRLLNFFDPLSVQNLENYDGAKRLQEFVNETTYEKHGYVRCQVLEHLLSIEMSPFTLESSKRSCVLISRLKVDVLKGEVPTPYLIPLTREMLGMFYNRFTLLWDAAIDCLASLIEEHGSVVWEVVLSHMVEAHELVHNFEENSWQDSKEKTTSKGIWAGLDAYLEAHENGTDHVTIVTLLLRTLQKIPKFSELHSRELVPLFLSFVERSGAKNEIFLKVARKYPSQLWKEWLNLLKKMKNARSLSCGPALKQVILNRFIIAMSPEIQEAAFDCLLNWKDPSLIPYVDHLKNIISSKTFREELTVWNVGREAQQVKDEHREELIPVLIKILFPKVVKIASKSLRKSAGDVRKIVILPFIASLETEELALLFCLLLRPLQSAFVPQSGTDVDQTTFAWEAIIRQGATSEFINWVDKESASALPFKRKLGFLNLVYMILDVFDEHHLEPYLHALLAFVLRFLEASPSTIEIDKNCDKKIPSGVLSFLDREKVEATKGHYAVVRNFSKAEADSESHVEQLQTASAVESINGVEDALNSEANSMVQFCKGADHKAKAIFKTNEGVKEEMDDMNFGNAVASNIVFGTRAIRTLCLKIICKLLSKFENLNLGPDFGKIFFQANESSIFRIKEESISNSTPGALFSCALAMSKTMELASYLTWNKALIPNLLSILSFKQASLSSISATLTFVENILHFEGIDSGQSIVATMLIPNLPILLAGLQVRISYYEEHRSGKRMGITVKRSLQIISRLSKHVKDHSQACQLVNALLPLLKTERLVEQESFSEILEIIKDFAQMLDAELVDKCLHLLGSLLVSLAFQRVRLAVCTLLHEFAQARASLSFVAEILTDLNAMSKTRVDEYDYDARLDAYSRVTASFLSQIPSTESLLLLSHFIYDMSSEDMSLRHSASNTLKLFVKFTGSLSEETNDFEMQKVPEGQHNKPCIECVPEGYNSLNERLSGSEILYSQPSSRMITSTKLVTQKFLLPIIRNAMGTEILATRREWVSLLREMVLHFSEASPFQELRPLISDDLEVDFFSNIVHLQVHRRIKAMARFRTLSDPGQFSEGTLTRILAPLFMTSLFEAKLDKEGNLVEAAIQAVGCIAAQLKWTSYFSLVMHCFRLIVSRVEHQRVILRLVCSILENFHFYTEDGIDPQMVKIIHNDVSSDKLLTQLNGLDMSTKGPHVQAVPSEVYSQLHRRVLPEITAFLVSKEGIVNSSVALAVVKVLKVMPHEILEGELPRSLQIIINLLKSRSQAVRDEARSALVSVAEALGATYLSYIVNTLQKTLTRGCELHVLGYTLNSILVKVVPTLKVGDLDYCLDEILDILEGDIFGTVSEEKDVEALSVKMKEIKHMRSFESIILVAQVTSFRLKCFTLLSPVRKNLPNSYSSKVQSSIKSYLKHLATGFLSNPSIRREELFVFIHGLIEEDTKADAAAACGSLAKPINESFSNEIQIDQLQREANSPNLPPSASVLNVHLLTEFALNLFHRNIKRVKVHNSDGHTLSMLDPFVQLLEKCLYSSKDGVLSGAMKCLSHLLRLPLPSAERLGRKPVNLLFSIVQGSGKSETPLMQACLKLWVVLLRNSSKTKISQVQTRMLLDFPVFVDLETSPSPIALTLLKAIVRRKLLVPELYDMMTRVERLMVTSQMLPIRQQCSQILLQFLLDYPLGPKRLQQHLDFLVNNLGYKHATGREAVLEMMHTVVIKFPETFIEEHVENLFFPMVTRLVNDDDNNIRAMVGTVLKLLIGRASPQSLQHIIEVCFTWLQKENRHLWRLGTQLTGFLIETLKGKFSRHVDRALEAVTCVIEQHLCLSEDYGEVHCPEQPSSVSWEEAYFALTMVEKLYQQFPELLNQLFCEKLWDFILLLLLHQHMWIRKACLRLISMFVIKYGTPDVTHMIAEPSLLMHPSRLILIVASICQQLDTGFFDEEMSDMIVRSLAFITGFLHSLLQALAKSSSLPGLDEFLNCENQICQTRISKALKLLNADKYEDGSNLLMNASHVSMNSASFQPAYAVRENKSNAVSADKEVSATVFSEKMTHFILLLVFQKVERTGLRLHSLQTKTVFKWFVTISTQLGGDAVLPFLQFMLRPLFKITEGFSAKVVPEDIRASGEDVLNQLREIVGVEEFLSEYNSIRHSVKQRTEQRKRIQKISSLVDPEKHAKRKLHLIAKRRAQKRRKVGETRK